MFCKATKGSWGLFHDWNNWEHFERNMTTVTTVHGVQTPGLTYTEHWQKKTCKNCGYEKREVITKDGD